MLNNYFVTIMLVILGLTNTLFSSNCPIIFIHGQKGGDDAKPEKCWEDWNGIDFGKPYRTAMDKILAEEYGGYSPGDPLNCSIDSTPRPTGGETRKIYNFSYYNPDGSRGVISLSEGMTVYVSHDWNMYAETMSYNSNPYPPDKILPTFRNNDLACGGCCCLFPTAGVMGYRFLKEKTDTIEERRLSFGINYSLGSALTGHDYWRGAGEMIDYRKLLYWVNKLDIAIGYTIRPPWELESGFGYMWGREKKRIAVFHVIVNGQEEYLSDGDWDISAFTLMCLIKFMKKNIFLKSGFEWYFAKGINYSYMLYQGENKEVVIKTNGMAPGCILGVGYTSDLLSFLKLELSISGRYGLIKNPNYESTEELVRSGKNYLSFVGLYLRLGIKYNFLIKKGGEK